MIALDAVYEERYWYPDDGGALWIAGYQLVDDDGRFLGRDAPELHARRVRVANVAGAGQHHAEALASDAAAPGRRLSLRRDPGNEHDPNAIAVYADAEQVGWVPRELAAELASQLDSGKRFTAVCLRERRPSPRDPRSGLTMLLAPAEAIELREVSPARRRRP